MQGCRSKRDTAINGFITACYYRDVSGNETLLSIVDESAKQALLSTRQHVLFLLLPNKTLLSIGVSPNETLLSIVGGV
eukprot:8019216-Pyramimonas_sp.AAC.1